MQFRTNILAIIAYSVLALVVGGIVAWSGIRHRRNEQLLAQLLHEQAAQPSTAPDKTNEPRRSMRPALIRLERLLEERTELYREQRDQLRKQISGRDQLQEEYNKLSKSYEDLLNEHQLLVNELEFYLGALALDEQSGTASLPRASTTEAPEEVPNESNEQDLPDWMPIEPNDDLLVEDGELIADLASDAMIATGEPMVPVLAEMLGNEEPKVRAWAAWVLGQMGADAEPATLALEMLLDDTDDAVIQAASDALDRIEAAP